MLFAYHFIMLFHLRYIEKTLSNMSNIIKSIVTITLFIRALKPCWVVVQVSTGKIKKVAGKKIMTRELQIIKKS